MKIRSLNKAVGFSIAIALAIPAYEALGESKGSGGAANGKAGITPYSAPKASLGSSKKSEAGYRSFNMMLPVVTLARQAQGRIEYNMGGIASISIEGTRMVRGEELSDQEVLESGDSLETDAVQGAVLISRYSYGATMSGFYWSLGTGYRKVDAYWRSSPEGDDASTRMSLADQKGKLNHHLDLSGGTGHGRIGWRWVGESFPMLLGAHIGVRHFNATVKDVEDSKLQTDSMRISPTTNVEKKNLKRRMMTALEPGVELGVAF
jgi:hypothetical protein